MAVPSRRKAVIGVIGAMTIAGAATAGVLAVGTSASGTLSDRPAAESLAVNESGQRYGSAVGRPLEDQPDLIWAEGDDGTSGYVKKADLYGGPEPKNPAEAATWVPKDRTIPLYAADGITVIGEFTLKA